MTILGIRYLGYTTSPDILLSLTSLTSGRTYYVKTGMISEINFPRDASL